MQKVRTAILISGEGTNMQALINAASAPDYPARIALVISNRPGAGGLKRAATAGIPALTLDHKSFPTRAEFDNALDNALMEAGIELICMAGFMRLLGEDFVNKWHNRQLNIHPSLLPAYKGLHTHKRALADGVKIAGCTVHVVRPAMDSGPIIAQAAVPVLPGDDEDALKARIQKAEHRLYPAALAAIASGMAEIGDNTVNYTDTFKEQLPLFSPIALENETQ